MARARARYEITAKDRSRIAIRSAMGGLRRLKDAAFSTKTALAGAVGVLGGIGAGVALRSLFRGAEALGLLADATGAPQKELEKLQKMFETVGKGDAFPDFLVDLQESLREALAEPGGTRATALERMGLDPKDFERAGFDLVRALAKSFRRSRDVFSLREFMGDEASTAIMALSRDFDAVTRSAAGRTVDTGETDRATEALRAIRSLFGELKRAASDFALRKELVEPVTEVVTRVAELLKQSTSLREFWSSLKSEFLAVGLIVSIINSGWRIIVANVKLAMQTLQENRQIWDDIKIATGGVVAAGRAIANIPSSLVDSAATNTQTALGPGGVNLSGRLAAGGEMGLGGPFLMMLSGILKASQQTADNTRAGAVARAQ